MSEQPRPKPANPAPATVSVRNVILAGFMGSGKSSVGRRLAERLGWTFVDTDDLVEALAGKSIPEIFAEVGEPGFRRYETEVAKSLGRQSSRVIATGGGMVLDAANRQLLEEAGLLVLLDATPETLWQRVRHATHRPLLRQADPEAELRRLWQERRPAYESIRTRISTDNLSHDDVVDALMELISR